MEVEGEYLTMASILTVVASKQGKIREEEEEDAEGGGEGEQTEEASIEDKEVEEINASEGKTEEETR